MPLLAPALPPGAVRLAEAAARWDSALTCRPDLLPAVDLQRRLISRLIGLSDLVARGRLPRLTLPARYLAAKLARGVPVLGGEPIPLPVAVLKPTLLGLCDDLAAGGAGGAAERIKATLTETRLDAGSLL